ncbi:DgyrCDS11044 [Dimorphilus gyrociliatus]|uniref:DgyrCDS11044 n=1 Tax=Dimorphilus gyrociliatus TaxID=2664684 RepID=A0A7I8W242_9ANNE|nr:DgyrCDS11044 [Dimorphilus gyrociliatus]
MIDALFPKRPSADRQDCSKAPCYLQNSTEQCICCGFTLMCANLNWTSLPVLNEDVKSLDISGNRLQHITFKYLQYIPNIQKLTIMNNMIDFIEDNSFSSAASLQYLILYSSRKLDNNNIQSLDSGVFYGLTSLEHLFLGDNKLEYIGEKVFYGLENLVDLSLARNSLTTLEYLFKNLTYLEALDLRNNDLENLVNEDVFSPLEKLTDIYLPHFHMCSLALHVRKCYPRGDGISNHKNLLASPVLRVCVWIVSILSVVGNMRVIVSRIRSMRKISRGRGHSLLIVHLAVADMLMGIYLFILAVQDALFRGHYLSMQKRWRNSSTCTVCGLLTTSSYLASAFFIGLISMERLVSVERPLQTLSRNFTTLQAFTVIIWTVVGILVIMPLIPQLTDYFSTTYYTNNGACLPLYIHEPRAVGWRYSAGTFLATTLLCSMLVSIVYLKMYTAIRRSSASISSSGHGREVRLARRRMLPSYKADWHHPNQ